MRVLVTGSSGFVGGWLCSHLVEVGDEVVTFPDTLDIRDAEAFGAAVEAAAPEGIIHLAAQASVGTSWSDPTTTWQVNALGTVNLLAAAGDARVLLVSSAEVYGLLGPDDLPVGEDHPFAPTNPYAASKAAAELAGYQTWAGRGTEIVRARPFNHTGPGQRADFVVPSLARQIIALTRGEGRELRTGNLSARRDLTDVRDVVRAYRLLLERGEPGAAYNVCRGTSVEISTVAERLMALAGVDLPVVVDPTRIRPVDQPDLRGDPSRVTAATGWSPAIALEDTLSAVLDYWKGQ